MGFPDLLLLLTTFYVSCVTGEEEVYYADEEYRCGSKFPVNVDGTLHSSGCRTNSVPPGNKRCCSKYGWCGSSEEHCCDSCAVYKFYTSRTLYTSYNEFAKFTALEGAGMTLIDCKAQVLESRGFLSGISFRLAADKVESVGFVCFGEALVMDSSLMF